MLIYWRAYDLSPQKWDDDLRLSKAAARQGMGEMMFFLLAFSERVSSSCIHLYLQRMAGYHIHVGKKPQSHNVAF